MNTVIPKALRPGDTIGIIAPARWPPKEWLDTTSSWLAMQGFKTKIHPQTALREGRLGGPDSARAGALNDMFGDDEVQAILCARGGQGSVRLLDLVNYDLIRSKPKIFCGFSDVTVLLNAIHGRTGLITFHSPMAWNFAQAQNDARTGADFTRLLIGQYPAGGMDFPVKALKTGSAEGRLVGGNMGLLACLAHTPYDWSADGCILCIEDVGEEVYRLDHTLWHLKKAGKLAGVRGVIAGEMTLIADDPPYGRTFEELLREYLPPGIPVCMDFPCGHGDYLTTLPIGIKARLEVAEKSTRLTFLESPVTL